MRKGVYTDNTHLAAKVRVRREWLEQRGSDRVAVLDAFAGEGKVWARIQKELPDLNIDYLGIDKKKYSRPDVIMGDNLKVMRGMDLNRFDLIDLDAYGFPWEQLQVVSFGAPDVPVASTAIGVTLGPLPYGVLKEAGIPEDWAKDKDIPHALFNRWRWQFWDHFCYAMGYRATSYEIHLDKPSVKRYEILTRSS